MSKVKVRVSRRRKKTISVPAEIADALGIAEGDYIIEAEEGNVVMKPAINPFEYALKVKKFAETTFEEIEKESEEMQNEWAEDT